MPDPNINFYVSCPPGLEPVLLQECSRLGLIPLKENEKIPSQGGEDSGGFLFEGNYSDVYRCNLHLRTASRVILRIGEFYAAAFSELRKKAARLEWESYFTSDKPVSLRVTCHKSRLYHSDAVAERVMGAIQDRFKKLNHKSIRDDDKGKENQLILVRIVNDLCTISIDSSGEPLHKRGYRQALAKAPLRETLAAGLILLTGWDERSPVIDPFCGSGTIPIEAALIAQQIPPGIFRPFSFENWPVCDKDKWQNVKLEARKEIREVCPLIFGFDRDKGAIGMAVANAARAGQMDRITFRQQAVSYLEPTPEKGFLITNPPYGVRTSEKNDLRNLYARFGEILNQQFQGWKIGILSSDHALLGNLALGTPEKQVPLQNGGLKVYYSIYSK